MKTNCEIGDLAVIIRDEDFPANIGAFVKVISLPDPDAYPGQPAWLVQPATPIWSFEWDAEKSEWPKTRASCDVRETNIPDADLKPIRGLTPDEKTETEETKEDLINA